MKSLKYSLFLVLAMLLNSCEVEYGNFYPFYEHWLWLSFQDTSGNDLVKGIGYNWWQSDVVPEEEAGGGPVNPDLYTLKIIFPENAVDVWEKSPEIRPELTLIKPNYGEWNSSKGYYLNFSTSSVKKDNVEMLTFKLSCPYVFGDNSTHEIVTYWRKSNVPKGTVKCYRIVFDGKEINEITYENYEQISLAKIVLDRQQ